MCGCVFLLCSYTYEDVFGMNKLFIKLVFYLHKFSFDAREIFYYHFMGTL